MGIYGRGRGRSEDEQPVQTELNHDQKTKTTTKSGGRTTQHSGTSPNIFMPLKMEDGGTDKIKQNKSFILTQQTIKLKKHLNHSNRGQRTRPDQTKETEGDDG